jgi:hypothetical protein
MKNGNREDSLLISGIDSSTIHQRLDFYSREQFGDSRLDLSDSQESAIKVQESFSISEIYRDAKENFDPEPSKEEETNDFFKLLEDNTGIRHKTHSKLDESSVVGENCKVLIKDIEKNDAELIKKQQKKYCKAFVVLQAHFVSAKEASDRKINMLNVQIQEANAMIREHKEFVNRLEAGVEQKIESIKEDALKKFKIEADKLMQKFQHRDNDLKKITKNKIIRMRKEIDEHSEQAFRSFDSSRAKNSEDLLRKNCEMRLKLAFLQGDSQNSRNCE